MEIRAVKNTEPELKLKKQADVNIHKRQVVAVEKDPQIIFSKKLSMDVLRIRNRNGLGKELDPESDHKMDKGRYGGGEEKSRDKQRRLYIQGMTAGAAIKGQAFAKKADRQTQTEAGRNRNFMTNGQAKESYRRKMKIRALSKNLRLHPQKNEILPQGVNRSNPATASGVERSGDPKIHYRDSEKNSGIRGAAPGHSGDIAEDKKRVIRKKSGDKTNRDSKKTARKSRRNPQFKDRVQKQAVRERKLQYILSKVSGSEGEDSLWQMAKDIFRMKLSLAGAKAAQYAGAILISLSGMVLMAVFPVVLIVILLYCSPIAAFMENPSGDTPSIQEVLGGYYMEFNQAVSANSGENGAVAYLHEKDGNYVSNYMDTLMVYMVQYGTGDLGVVMDEKHKRLLKNVFDEMNRFEDQNVTTTIQAGQSLGNVVTSAYCSCSICCGQWAGGPTASGAMPKADHTIAVDASAPFVPMGPRVIMGGKEYVVEDTGAFARYGVQFDIYFDSHSAASRWGHQTMEAFLADGNENTVSVTKKGSYVKNLNFEDYIALGKLNREQEELLREVMGEGFRSEIPSSGTGSDVANLALTKVGCQYSQEHRYEEGYYDCSSLVQRCYAQFGISLPAIASTQGQYMVEHGLEVTEDMLEPGDVIFYSYENNGQYRNISHVAIYIGNGRMVHASSPERGVVNDPFSPSNVGLYGRPGRGK